MIGELYKEGMGYSYFNRMKEAEEEANKFKENYKRLEQENKELGRKAFLAEQNVRTTAATFCEKDNKIIELEQENKALKKQIESQKGLITIGGKQQYEMTIAYDKFKTALEKIKDLANAIVNGTHFTNDIEGHLKELAKEIINICEEL